MALTKGHTFTSGEIVTPTKLNNLVDDATIDANAIDSDHYVDGSIDLAHLSVDSVDASKIVDGTITEAEIADGTITAAKLDSGVAGASAIDDLTDVDTTTAAPTDGQALVWDNAASKWEPGTVGGSSKTLLSTVISVFNKTSGSVDPSTGLTFGIDAGNSSVSVPDGAGGTSTVNMSTVPSAATEVCVFAALDTTTASSTDNNRWEYRHGSSGDWLPLVRSNNSSGYPNSGTLWIPLDSSGDLNVRLVNDTTNAIATCEDVSLQITGYAS